MVTLRLSVYRIYRKARGRDVEHGQKETGEVVGACKEDRLVRQGVGGEQPTKVSDCGFEERSIGLLAGRRLSISERMDRKETYRREGEI
jgi:hypothetical protein